MSSPSSLEIKSKCVTAHIIEYCHSDQHGDNESVRLTTYGERLHRRLFPLENLTPKKNPNDLTSTSSTVPVMVSLLIFIHGC